MSMRNTKSRSYQDLDLAEAEETLRRLLRDDKLRGTSPGRYRAAIAGARARIETITAALERDARAETVSHDR